PHPPATPLEIQSQSRAERKVMRSRTRHVESRRFLEVELADVILRQESQGHAAPDAHVGTHSKVTGETGCLRRENRFVDGIANRADASLHEWRDGQRTPHGR